MNGQDLDEMVREAAAASDYVSSLRRDLRDAEWRLRQVSARLRERMESEPSTAAEAE